MLIVLGLLLIVGIHLLFRSNGTNMDIQYSQFSKESIQQQKQYYRSQTSPDYQIELDLYDFIEENDLYTTKEFQLENSWMYLAINEAFYEKQAQLSEASLSSEQRTEIQTELEELKQSVRERDYKKYCEYKQKEIAQELSKQYKIEIDKKKIDLKETIKSLGTHTVSIKLFEGIIGKIKVDVIG